MNVFPIHRLLYDAYKTYTDRPERQLVKKILFQAAVVVDVGPTLEFTRSFSSAVLVLQARFHFFEPSPDNFKRLPAVTRELSMGIDIHPSGRKLIFQCSVDRVATGIRADVVQMADHGSVEWNCPTRPASRRQVALRTRFHWWIPNLPINTRTYLPL